MKRKHRRTPDEIERLIPEYDLSKLPPFDPKGRLCRWCALYALMQDEPLPTRPPVVCCADAFFCSLALSVVEEARRRAT